MIMRKFLKLDDALSRSVLATGHRQEGCPSFLSLYSHHRFSLYSPSFLSLQGPAPFLENSLHNSLRVDCSSTCLVTVVHSPGIMACSQPATVIKLSLFHIFQCASLQCRQLRLAPQYVKPGVYSCPALQMTHDQIWRIWPAVLLHTVFATSKFLVYGYIIINLYNYKVIVLVSKKTSINLGIPNVLLTLLGK